MMAPSDAAKNATRILTVTSLLTNAQDSLKSGVVTIGENFEQRSEEVRKTQRAELREAQKEKRKRQQPEHEIKLACTRRYHYLCI